MDWLISIDFTLQQWFWLMLCACLVGMAKTGLSGVGILVVPLLAAAFGGRESTGILLPILIFADAFAVKYYNRHAEWKHVFRLLPWTIAGIFIGLFFGKSINDEQFKLVIAILVFVGIAIILIQDIFRKKIPVPKKLWFAALMGLAGGFSTMVGNAAGPVMMLYLLSMRLPKQQFIGTAAWFFFIVNLFKVPLHVFVWETITVQSFLTNTLTIPAIFLGAVIGIQLVKWFSEKFFRIFVIASTIAASVFLI